MAQDGFFDFLLDLLNKLQIFIARPSVQVQLIAIAVILGGIGFVSGIVILALNRRQEKSQAKSDKTLYQRLLLTGTNLLVFPILSLIATNLTTVVLLSQNQAVGLLRLLAFILSVLLAYRCSCSSYTCSLPKNECAAFIVACSRPYLPSLWLIKSSSSLSMSMSWQPWLSLPTCLRTPITLGALFLATVGLYFWIDGISGLNELIFLTATRFTSVNAGRLEASLTLGAIF